MQCGAGRFKAGSLNRFLAVGAVNTVFGFGFFPAVYLLAGNRVGVETLLAVNYVACPVFSYLTHLLVTFAAKRPTWISVWRYVAFWLVAFAVNSFVLAAVAGRGRLVVLATQVGYGIAVTLINFVVFRRFVFVQNARR